MPVQLPPGRPRPRGDANGVAVHGRTVFVAGTTGWDARGRVVSDTLAGQVRQALCNAVDVLAVAGARPEHIVRMTRCVSHEQASLAACAEIGAAHRDVIGSVNAAVTAVPVSALIEDRAQVEIEVTAVIES